MSLWGSRQDELIRTLYRCQWDVAFLLRFVLLTCCIDGEGGGISEALGREWRFNMLLQAFWINVISCPVFGSWNSASNTLGAPLQTGWIRTKIIFSTEVEKIGHRNLSLCEVAFKICGSSASPWMLLWPQSPFHSGCPVNCTKTQPREVGSFLQSGLGWVISF